MYTHTKYIGFCARLHARAGLMHAEVLSHLHMRRRIHACIHLLIMHAEVPSHLHSDVFVHDHHNIIRYIDMHPYACTHREGEEETANSGSGKRNKSDPPVANEIKWVDPPVVNGINLDPPDESTTLVGRQTRFVDACTILSLSPCEWCFGVL